MACRRRASVKCQCSTACTGLVKTIGSFYAQGHHVNSHGKLRDVKASVTMKDKYLDDPELFVRLRPQMHKGSGQRRWRRDSYRRAQAQSSRSASVSLSWKVKKIREARVNNSSLAQKGVRRRPHTRAHRLAQSEGIRKALREGRMKLWQPHVISLRYNGTFFRSSYEVAFAKWCVRQGIKWEYEPKRFVVGDTVYIPDFYLPDFDIWVETKGFATRSWKLKFLKFKKQYPSVKIILATTDVLQAMEVL